MTIPFNKTLTLNFDENSMREACNVIDQVKSDYPDKSEDILDALATVLMFRAIEKDSPGAISRLISACKKAKQPKA